MQVDEQSFPAAPIAMKSAKFMGRNSRMVPENSHQTSAKGRNDLARSSPYMPSHRRKSVHDRLSKPGRMSQTSRPPKVHAFQGTKAEVFSEDDSEYQVMVRDSRIVWDKPTRRPENPREEEVWTENRGRRPVRQRLGLINQPWFHGMTQSQIRRVQRRYALTQRLRAESHRSARESHPRSSR